MIVLTSGNKEVVDLVERRLYSTYGPKARIEARSGALYTTITVPGHGDKSVRKKLWEATIIKVKYDPEYDIRDAPLREAITQLVEAWETHIETPGDYMYHWIIVTSVYYGYV